MTENDIKLYFKQLLECIQKLSELGYVHRDIKPKNCLFNFDSKKFMLIDFGLCDEISNIKSMHSKEIKTIKSKLKTKQNNYKENKNISNKYATPQIARKKSKFYYKTPMNRNRFTLFNNNSIHNDNEYMPKFKREGTRGYRAPEILFRSNQQNSKIDIFSAGLILTSILMKIKTSIFEPSNDAENLLMFISIFGWHQIYDVSRHCLRTINIRDFDKIGNHDIMYNNDNEYDKRILSSNNDIKRKKLISTGFEKWMNNNNKYNKLSYIIELRNKHLKLQNKSYNNWSSNLLEFLDGLTDPNHKTRLNPKKALQHSFLK